MTLPRIVVVLALSALLGQAGPVHSQASPLASVSVDTSHPGLTIPATFLGFSHEWNTAQLLMGPAAAPNPLYRQLVQNLLAYGAGPLIVRVGGNSTDVTTAPQPGVVEPFGQAYLDLGVHFVLGVNLGANDVVLAATQAQAYLQGMPAGSVDAIEIGNEPDLFHSNGHRPGNYTYTEFAHEFAAWRGAIEPLLPPGVGLMGPAWSSASSLQNLPAFLDQERPYLATVTQHWYAGTQCNGRTNPPDYLLRPDVATSGARAVAKSVTLAHQRGLPFRMGEINSISCGGEVGVSDIYASALWATDMLFEFANVGADGVNIHTGNGGGYALFTFNRATDSSGYTLQSVRPEYYGVLLFQQAAPAGSQVLPTSVQSVANVKTWATVDSSGSIRVVVLNKDQSAGGEVDLPFASGGVGSLSRLQAPSLNATTGITLGGQTFDGSSDGALQGASTTDMVVPAAGTYTFDVAPLSAALLTIPPSPPSQ